MVLKVPEDPLKVEVEKNLHREKQVALKGQGNLVKSLAEAMKDHHIGRQVALRELENLLSSQREEKRKILKKRKDL